MKLVHLLLLINLCFINSFSFAGTEKHDFSKQSWSRGRSCMVCHMKTSNMPIASPPNSRVVEIDKLTPAEKSAYEANSKNVTCLVCHTAQHSPVASRINAGSNIISGGGLNSGSTTLPYPKAPPGVVSSGSEASSAIRVINRGNNSLECLSCHDIHNTESNKMLKQDYWQNNP